MVVLQRRGGRAHRCGDAALLLHRSPLLAVSTFVNQLYQCLGYRTAATFLASCRQGIFFLPAVLLLPLWLHCAGVEMSQPVADLLTFVISMPFLAAFYRHHIRGHAE